MRDDYTEKPAFATYRDLIAQLSVRNPTAGSTSTSGPARQRHLRHRSRHRHRRPLA
jgi:hypothetical protein